MRAEEQVSADGFRLPEGEQLISPSPCCKTQAPQAMFQPNPQAEADNKKAQEDAERSLMGKCVNPQTF